MYVNTATPVVQVVEELDLRLGVEVEADILPELVKPEDVLVVGVLFDVVWFEEGPLMSSPATMTRPSARMTEIDPRREIDFICQVCPPVRENSCES